MSSIAKRKGPGARIPTTLILATAALAGIAGVPAALLGGSDALAMMGTGAALSLGTVLAAWACLHLALRGRDPHAVRLVVGGFALRLALLVISIAALVRATGLDPGRFVLWVVAFYFALVLVEAWILARDAAEPGGAA